jgi:YidC/Oxa1 family membrane protein insertase
MQIYLFATSIFGAATAIILRNPSFRKLANLTPLPNKESQEMWQKVAKGEISLDKVVGSDGQLRAFSPEAGAPKYQAPSKSARVGKSSKFRNKTVQNRGLTLKADTALPAHLQAPVDKSYLSNAELQDRDHDYNDVPKGAYAKLDWLGRNFQPRFMMNKFKLWLASMTDNKQIRARLLQTKKDREAEKIKYYESRRRGKL